ncbi:hypothetical protein [Gilvimarinus xylanilyticus]|uniref:Uncharacterized protein n=1 Tax=Gilvimarinus xylanilyticus TaxID=2944139 RepID=A0A9X2KUK8_9GAMM|nr:hypothetical protein [Gilvimarinus xylanilyticus]MCP8900372.1 hypothetical protein [Gilvimarinus xylanilyticus]
MPTVKEIIAKGKSGKVKGLDFVSYKTDKGYELHSNEKMQLTGETLQSSTNKIWVETLDEAVDLLKTEKYRIRLVCNDVSPPQRNMREWKALEIVF